jgi:hypothetical protein
MIVFELICADQHRFEGWFASGEDFSAQKKRRMLTCPLCGSGSVEKLPTARIRKTDIAAVPPVQPAPSRDTPKAPEPVGQAAHATLNDLINYVLLHSEDVGARFAQEARRIHREQAPCRDIRGTATPKEAEELLEEGVPVMPLPIPPQEEWH